MRKSKRKAITLLCALTMCMAYLIGVPLGGDRWLFDNAITASATVYTSSANNVSLSEGDVFVKGVSHSFSCSGYFHYSTNSNSGPSHNGRSGSIAADGTFTMKIDGTTYTHQLPATNNAWIAVKYREDSEDHYYLSPYNYVVKDASYSATTSFGYDGNAKTAVTGKNVSISGVNTATAIGTYTAYVEPAAGHAWSNGTTDKKTVNWSISRANISPSVSMNGWTYGGTASNPSVSGNTGNGSVTYQYKVSTAADSTYTTTKPSIAGTYTVRATIAQTANYNSATATKNFTISPRTATLTWKNTTFTYDGKSHAPTATVSNLVSGDSCTVTVTGAQTNVGSYTATASSLSNSNYTLPSSKTQTFSITKATNSWTKNPTAATLTYNGSAQVLLSAAPTAKFGSVVYSLTQNGTYSADAQKGTDAGSYTVYYKVNGTNNYTGLTGNISVTISKATPAAGHLTYTAPTDLTYNGSGKTASFTLKSPYTKAGTITAQYQKAGTTAWTATAPVDAGTYNVRAYVSGGDNFNAGYVTNSWSFTIEKKAPAVTPPTAVTGLKFTGEDQVLINAGTTSGGQMQYSLDNTSWSAELPKGNDVGEYTVYYRVSGGDNYKDDAGNTGGEPIKVYIDPAYYVTIPADISLTENNGQVSGSADVAAEYFIGSKRLTVTVNSQNNFNLAGCASETSGISVPYTVTRSGDSTALAQDGTVLSVTNKGRISVQLIMSADTSRIYAGAYRDTLTFKISFQ